MAAVKPEHPSRRLHLGEKPFDLALQSLGRGGDGGRGGGHLLRPASGRPAHAGKACHTAGHLTRPVRCFQHVPCDLARRRPLFLNRAGDGGGKATDLIDHAANGADGLNRTPGFALDGGDQSADLVGCLGRLGRQVFRCGGDHRKPLPASAARAASMVALSANRLVWPAMSPISRTTSLRRFETADLLGQGDCAFLLRLGFGPPRCFQQRALLESDPELLCRACYQPDLVTPLRTRYRDVAPSARQGLQSRGNAAKGRHEAARDGEPSEQRRHDQTSDGAEGKPPDESPGQTFHGAASRLHLRRGRLRGGVQGGVEGLTVAAVLLPRRFAASMLSSAPTRASSVRKRMTSRAEATKRGAIESRRSAGNKVCQRPRSASIWAKQRCIPWANGRARSVEGDVEMPRLSLTTA